MLKSLTVHNFALVEHAFIEFGTGLNIITGETGAGKSIIIDAIACVLGDRSSIESIRTGQDFFRVEAEFDISKHSEALLYLEEMAIPVDDAARIIVVRRLSSNGKNTVLINGCQTTVSSLKKFAQNLVDIHGQHESQSLLRPDTYIRELDSFSADIAPIINEYKSHYFKWRALEASLAEAENKSQERERRLDMLRWQSEEIAAARLQLNEDSEIEQQIKVLANSEKIANYIQAAYSGLNSEIDEACGALFQLVQIKKALEQAARFDEKLSPQVEIVTGAMCQLQEVEQYLQIYFQEMDLDAGRLGHLQTRMDTIYKLKKKYGASIAEILTYYQQAVSEIADLENYDNQVIGLRNKIEVVYKHLICLASEIDKLRRMAGSEFERQIEILLRDLGMAGARFLVNIESREIFNEMGMNQVMFFFSGNQGEEPRPLNKVASGGELSRIALALKAVNLDKSEIHSMIFDELDSGIGGKTAQMVAEKIAFVAQCKQVLCITHLPQIAVMGDCHIYIEKITEDERTKTIVYQLDDNERIKEIARMISGDDKSKSSLENALTMLNYSNSKKEKWKYKA